MKTQNFFLLLIRITLIKSKILTPNFSYHSKSTPESGRSLLNKNPGINHSRFGFDTKILKGISCILFILLLFIVNGCKKESSFTDETAVVTVPGTGGVTGSSGDAYSFEDSQIPESFTLGTGEYWTIVSDSAAPSGSSVLQAGAADCFDVNVYTSAGDVSFYYYDYSQSFGFLIDDTLIETLTGTYTDGQYKQYTYAVEEGIHDFRWCNYGTGYSWNNAEDNKEDYATLDLISFPGLDISGTLPAVESASPDSSSDVVSSGDSILLKVKAPGAIGGKFLFKDTGDVSYRSIAGDVSGDYLQVAVPFTNATNSSGILISSALYGKDENTCNATAYFQSECDGETSCTVSVSNSLCGDPASGTVKEVIVEYSCGGVTETETAQENTSITLTCTSSNETVTISDSGQKQWYVKVGNYSGGSRYPSSGDSYFYMSDSASTSSNIFGFEEGSLPESFLMHYSADWTASTTTGSSGDDLGSYSIKSGTIAAGESSCISLSIITDNGGMSFSWKAPSTQDSSSYSTYNDYFRFYLDDVEKLSNDTDTTSDAWHRYAEYIYAGFHTFKWCYSRGVNTYVPDNDAYAWVDNINISGTDASGDIPTISLPDPFDGETVVVGVAGQVLQVTIDDASGGIFYFNDETSDTFNTAAGGLDGDYLQTTVGYESGRMESNSTNYWYVMATNNSGSRRYPASGYLTFTTTPNSGSSTSSPVISDPSPADGAIVQKDATGDQLFSVSAEGVSSSYEQKIYFGTSSNPYTLFDSLDISGDTLTQTLSYAEGKLTTDGTNYWYVETENSDGTTRYPSSGSLSYTVIDPTSDWGSGFESGVPADLTMSGDADWDVTTDAKYGTYSLASGDIEGNQSSCFEISGDYNQVSFYQYVSSESVFDYLSFSIDGTSQDTWSGTYNSWSSSPESDTDTTGDHDFEWCYIKDGNGSEGQDKAFIDHLILSKE